MVFSVIGGWWRIVGGCPKICLNYKAASLFVRLKENRPDAECRGSARLTMPFGSTITPCTVVVFSMYQYPYLSFQQLRRYSRKRASDGLLAGS